MNNEKDKWKSWYNNRRKKMTNSKKWKLMKVISDRNEIQRSQDEFERIWYPCMGPYFYVCSIYTKLEIYYYY